jgi:hypothetical protein
VLENKQSAAGKPGHSHDRDSPHPPFRDSRGSIHALLSFGPCAPQLHVQLSFSPMLLPGERPPQTPNVTSTRCSRSIADGAPLSDEVRIE